MRSVLSGLTATAVVWLVLLGSARAGVLYDNGATDGSNGYSNISASAGLGVTRTLLDDFVIPAGQTWVITDLEWTHVWSSGAGAGTGTGLEMLFRADSAGTPGTPLTGLVNVTSYSDVATGNNFFGRPEIMSTAIYDPVILGAGTYWFEATIVGPENNFWLVRSTVAGSELWIDYSDSGGLQPGSNNFGPSADLNFVLTGTVQGGVVPEPSSLALALVGLMGGFVVVRHRKANP